MRFDLLGIKNYSVGKSEYLNYLDKSVLEVSIEVTSVKLSMS